MFLFSSQAFIFFVTTVSIHSIFWLNLQCLCSLTALCSSPRFPSLSSFVSHLCVCPIISPLSDQCIICAFVPVILVITLLATLNFLMFFGDFDGCCSSPIVMLLTQTRSELKRDCFLNQIIQMTLLLCTNRIIRMRTVCSNVF